jgi:hypothetical protein
MHTAVKIAPAYSGPVVHVLDASRAVGTVSSLLSEVKYDEFVRKNEEELANMRERHAGKKDRKRYISIEEARANKPDIDWETSPIYQPNKTGIETLENVSFKTLRDYIDWTPFFLTWEMKGKYPQIFESDKYGQEAKKLYDDANEMLDTIIENDWLTAKGVAAIFPANAVGDDVEVYDPADADKVLSTLHFLREQKQKGKGRANHCLADYIAPKESGRKDYIGGFAVTTGHGIEKHLARMEKDHDDYNSLLLKAVADRMAEAFAEYLHQALAPDRLVALLGAGDPSVLQLPVVQRRRRRVEVGAELVDPDVFRLTFLGASEHVHDRSLAVAGLLDGVVHLRDPNRDALLDGGEPPLVEVDDLTPLTAVARDRPRLGGRPLLGGLRVRGETRLFHIADWTSGAKTPVVRPLEPRGFGRSTAGSGLRLSMLATASAATRHISC